MKSFATILALFTAAAIAAPTSNAPRANSINFSLINDLSGASAASTITADGNPLRFGTTFLTTPLARNGRVFATSVQSTTPKAGVFCVVRGADGQVVGRLNERETFVDLDGQAGKAVEVDVSDFTLTCF